MFSPDGRWLAYVSDETGRNEVYLQAYPDPGPRMPVSVSGGMEPSWSQDGRELFYRDGPRMLVVDIETKPSLVVLEPRQLFERVFRTDVNGHPHYDVGEKLGPYEIQEASGMGDVEKTRARAAHTLGLFGVPPHRLTKGPIRARTL